MCAYLGKGVQAYIKDRARKHGTSRSRAESDALREGQLFIHADDDDVSVIDLVPVATVAPEEPEPVTPDLPGPVPIPDQPPVEEPVPYDPFPTGGGPPDYDDWAEPPDGLAEHIERHRRVERELVGVGPSQCC